MRLVEGGTLVKSLIWNPLSYAVVRTGDGLGGMIEKPTWVRLVEVVFVWG